jgi:Protein of unknown function (DUF992)
VRDRGLIKIADGHRSKISEEMVMRRRALTSGAALLAVGALLAPQPSEAQPAGVSAGFLTCQMGGGWGFILSSSRPLSCTYSQAGYAEQYVGTVNKFGVDIGYLGGAVMVWAVVAPTTSLVPGTLAGNYAGVTGGAAVGLGGGANVLFGGSTQTLMLQPVSVQGNAGLNVAAGIAAMNLQPAYRTASLTR